MIAVVVSTIILAIAIVFTLVEIGDMNETLCVTAQRSADTKELFVDVIDRAYTEQPEAAPFIAEMREAVAAERTGLVGYCPPHD